MEKIILVSEAAKLTGLTEDTIRELCKNGELGTYLKRKGRKRGQYVISPAKLQEWLGTN